MTIIEVATGGLLLGVLSSFHCVGMCGPLALSLPVSHLSSFRRKASVLLYHIGRLTTYTLLGLLFGLAGRRFFLAGVQQWMSIIAGSIILFFVIFYFINKTARYPRWMSPFYSVVQKSMEVFLKSKHIYAFGLLGMANALLPCGMVYLAIAGALNTAGVLDGAAFMFFFGAGTLPAMLALTVFKFRASFQVRSTFRKAMPIVMGAMALLLILRGLNLGIPFLSPEIDSSTAKAVSCH